MICQYRFKMIIAYFAVDSSNQDNSLQVDSGQVWDPKKVGPTLYYTDPGGMRLLVGTTRV